MRCAASWNPAIVRLFADLAEHPRAVAVEKSEPIQNARAASAMVS